MDRIQAGRKQRCESGLRLAPHEHSDEHRADDHPEEAQRVLRDRVQSEHLEAQRVPPRGERPVERGLDLRRIPRSVQDLNELSRRGRSKDVVVVVTKPEVQRRRVHGQRRRQCDENDTGNDFTQSVSPAESPQKQACRELVLWMVASRARNASTAFSPSHSRPKRIHRRPHFAASIT